MAKRRFLVLGATGQLGGALCELAAKQPYWEVRGLSHADLEIRDATAVRGAIAAFRPWVVLNATAWNHVEAAEADPGSAFSVNAAAVAVLARVCRETHAFFVHFSTDYVFDGRLARPYREDDSTGPVNLYGLSKLAGEEAIRLITPRHCIFRTCGLYGGRRSPRAKPNFVEAILARAARGEPLKVRSDLVCTPTSAPELAEKVLQALQMELVGTFHATNRGHCTWHEFAAEIVRSRGLRAEVTPIAGDENREGARRPAWSVLDPAALAAAGVRPMSPWQEALAAHLAA